MRLPLAPLALAMLATPLAAQTAWTTVPPEQARRTGFFANRLLTESSGVAVSRRFRGVLWTQNDGGNAPLLFATDTAGRDLGAFRVRGADDVDWEDIALGPCGDPAAGAQACLYIADTGDNKENRKSVAIWRVPEPDPASARSGAMPETVEAERLAFRYPDGAHDVEAVWVAPSGDVHLVTKGRSGGVRHFLLRAGLWGGRGKATAELVQSLPIDRAGRADRLVTGAALSPDGRRVVVRTYGEAFFFTVGADGRLVVPPRPLACNLGGLELQGEGVAWLDGERLVLTSERALLRHGTVTIVRCELPPIT